jgi:hypothetical protein
LQFPEQISDERSRHIKSENLSKNAHSATPGVRSLENALAQAFSAISAQEILA